MNEPNEQGDPLAKADNIDMPIITNAPPIGAPLLSLMPSDANYPVQGLSIQDGECLKESGSQWEC
jgi:hypothetical protein